MNWARVGAIIHKQLVNSRRDIFRIFDIFWWPTFQLFIWGLFSQYLQKASVNGLNLVSVLVGGVILWTFFDRSSRDISMAIMDEVWNRNLVNLFSTPLTAAEYIMGVVIVAVIKLIVSAIFMILLATVFYGFHVNLFGWYIAPVAVGLVVMGWSVSLFIQAAILRFGHTVEVFIWATAVLLQPFSCVFYPVTALPFWAQKIALLLPSAYLFENMRQLLAGHQVSSEQLAISFGLNGVYFLVSLWVFYQSFHYAKDQGLLVKYY